MPRGEKFVTHGNARIGKMTPTYRTWQAMRARCHNPNAIHYDSYGGRGINICDRWNDFSNFLADMGERPNGKSIDRIDPNDNYEPTNCRWATAKEQTNNQRKSRITLEQSEIIKNDPRFLRVIAAEYGVSYNTISLIKLGKWRA